MEEYKRFTISLPQDLYEKFEEFRNKIGISRSDAIRKSMHLFMIQEENISTVSENVVGCITIMMTHEHVDLNHEHSHSDLHDSDHDHDYSSKSIYASVQQTDEILKNDIQHHFHDIIISTMHVHLEYEKCLEIIAVSGPYERVKKLKDDLQRLKSVLSIGFFIIDKEIAQNVKK
ncbi:MAG: CopG family ribbon-helix-helix protein [Candidatus Lokiarchaeota archaeon]|nr:CopG family ribbon-helix-helix protein [Candidatus Lokiarchaeota archaeon]